MDTQFNRMNNFELCACCQCWYMHIFLALFEAMSHIFTVRTLRPERNLDEDSNTTRRQGRSLICNIQAYQKQESCYTPANVLTHGRQDDCQIVPVVQHLVWVKSHASCKSCACKQTMQLFMTSLLSNNGLLIEALFAYISHDPGRYAQHLPTPHLQLQRPNHCHHLPAKICSCFILAMLSLLRSWAK